MVINSIKKCDIDVRKTLYNSIIVAGRYAELFSYDDNKQLFSLDNPT